ncbi:porin [uncultured Methylibium sp.]|uniref:porin n=1 Tax=uncultured Methylibium sp. TaxID=381093 RepID=UPI0025EBC53B|nr:porin [uncultured Methylibium sp.]
MKKLALAAALAAAFTGSAFAQSSVTLYGRINTSAEVQKVGSQDEKYVLQNNASRWGLRGSEDLGGGLNAFFGLESGFSSDTGAGAGGFSRDAYVGLKSASLGQVRMGRFFSAIYYATADYISNHNHDTGTSSDVLYAYRIDLTNAVQYSTPSFGGFVGTATVAAGEGTTDKTYELVGNYSAGPLHVGGGYSETERRLTQAKDKSFSVSGFYSFGAFSIGALYERDDFETLAAGGQQLGSRDYGRIAGIYTLGAAEFHLNYGQAKAWDGLPNSGAKQYTAGINYNLSKRTKVYGFFTKIDDGAAGFYGGDFRSLAALGIRHNF